MEIKHLKKERTPEKHDYSLGVRLTKEDFKNDKIKEIVLKIKVPSFLSWNSTKEVQKKEKENYTIFEIRKERSLYLEDTPFEILGPESDIGEILYSVTDENFSTSYQTEVLGWELYGDGVLAKTGNRPLSELHNF